MAPAALMPAPAAGPAACSRTTLGVCRKTLRSSGSSKGMRALLHNHEPSPDGPTPAPPVADTRVRNEAPASRSGQTRSGRRSSLRRLDANGPAAPAHFAEQTGPAQVAGVEAARVANEDASGVTGDGYEPVTDPKPLVAV